VIETSFFPTKKWIAAGGGSVRRLVLSVLIVMKLSTGFQCQFNLDKLGMRLL
jgi:hypothetical protein